MIFYLNSKNIKLRILSNDEEDLKKTIILVVHNKCHFDNDRLFSLIKTTLWYYKEGSFKCSKTCTICLSKQLMNTEPIIISIVSNYLRDIY